MGDVAEAPLLVADLALDAQRAAVADLLQRPHERRNVHLALTERHFLAPLARRRRPVGVLDVDAADVGAEDLHRPQRIALVVQEHVGGVEIHLQVGAFQLVQGAAQQVGALLAGLEGDGDALGLGHGADLAERVEERLAVGVVRLGQEPGVQRQIRQAEGAGAVERPGEAFEAGRPVGGVAETAGASDRGRAWCSPPRGSRAWRRSGRKPAARAASGRRSPSSQSAWCGSPHAICTTLRPSRSHSRRSSGTLLTCKRPAAHADRQRFDGHDEAPVSASGRRVGAG